MGQYAQGHPADEGGAGLVPRGRASGWDVPTVPAAAPAWTRVPGEDRCTVLTPFDTACPQLAAPPPNVVTAEVLREWHRKLSRTALPYLPVNVSPHVFHPFLPPCSRPCPPSSSVAGNLVHSPDLAFLMVPRPCAPRGAACHSPHSAVLFPLLCLEWPPISDCVGVSGTRRLSWRAAHSLY